MKIPGRPLGMVFFDRDAQEVARDLLGKVLIHLHNGCWLAAQIIETEAYYKSEKGSHASLGFTEGRKGLFMDPGTIYMYYARGGDSFNISCRGAGNAVLIKSGLPFFGADHAAPMLARMTGLNPLPSGAARTPEKLCSGQTLVCKALGLKVPDWNRKPVTEKGVGLLDVGYRPAKFIRTTRLGIPEGRDGHLPYRFIDFDQASNCTKNPLTLRKAGGMIYRVVSTAGGH